MAARKDLSRKVRAALAKGAQAEFRNGAKIRVFKSGYKNYLRVYVTSSGFERVPLRRRVSKVFDWLYAGLTPGERALVTGVLPLTPSEEREMYGTAV